MTDETKKHKGKEVREKIDKLGIKIKEVAKNMGVSRSTLYNYFKRKDLDDGALLEVSKGSRYDFSLMYPELIPLKKEWEEKEGLEIFGRRTTEELVSIQRKYYKLLEKYTVLLKFLVRLATEYDLKELGEEVINFKEKYLTEEEISLGEKMGKNKN